MACGDCNKCKVEYSIIGYRSKDNRAKLLSFGLTPSTTFEIIRTAPLGDPIEIKVRGYFLTLRKLEFDNLIIEKL